MPKATKPRYIATGHTVLKRNPQNTGEAAREPKNQNRTERLQARAVQRIFDRQTGDLVGWLYEWNNGVRCPRWKTEVHDDVFYE